MNGEIESNRISAKAVALIQEESGKAKTIENLVKRIAELEAQVNAEYEGWKPTAGNINRLPIPIRKYIHDVETLCDPAGIVRENTIVRDALNNLESENLRIIAENNELEAENKRLREASEWKPIETAPKDGQILVCGGTLNHGYYHNPTVGSYSVHYDDGQWIIKYGRVDDEYISNPTHWMPLPEPPKEQK